MQVTEEVKKKRTPDTVEKLVDDRTHCCCFDSCYLACDDILMKISDMGFCETISARGLRGSSLAEGIEMSCDGLVNMRQCVSKN